MRNKSQLDVQRASSDDGRRAATCDLRLITLRMRHHAAPSGYHRLTDVLSGTVITATLPRSLLSRAALKVLAPMTEHSGSQWYHRASLAAELTAAGHWLRTRRTLFHFLYGENSYRYLGQLKHTLGRGNRLVATYHTPSWRLRELVKDTGHIKRLDAVVVVSTSQLDYFRSLLGRERVFYVPHGIDTQYFRPAADGRRTRFERERPYRERFERERSERERSERERCERFRFICVGHHLRDFETLAGAADVLWQHNREAEIVVVADPDQLGPLAQLPNVRNLSKVTDEQLLNLYQTSDALLLPLADATANNALLEGMACGLPVISTDLIGVRDYVATDCCVLTPRGDADALAAAALQACNHDLDLAAMATASRRAAERLDWSQVARDMQGVYATVTGDDCGHALTTAPKPETNRS